MSVDGDVKKSDALDWRSAANGVGAAAAEASAFASGIARPNSVGEVLGFVQRAREDGIALYPVSTGRNWGYGSDTPPRRGCRLLDLSGMNAIRNANEISVRNPVAVIEPGVTQKQLYDFLQAHCPELTFNVTGSAAETSLIGNALDRGVGYLGPRREDLFGLEIVTGAGQIVYTGFRRLGADSPLAHSHPYGLGPMLDGLFFQGNYGIVTSACFRLVKREACQVAVSLALPDPLRLADFLDALCELKRSGVMSSVTHIGNRARTHATLMYGISKYLETVCQQPPGRVPTEAAKALKLLAPNEWTSLGGLSGSRAQVSAALSVVKRRLSGLASVRVVTEQRLNLGYRVMNSLRFLPRARAHAATLAAIRPLHGLALGVPMDAAIENLMWRYGQGGAPAVRFDSTRCGILFINPALPMDGRFVADLMARMEAKAGEFGHELFATINIETATSLVAVVNLLFDKGDPEQVERAHACASALHVLLRSSGLEVYRARVDMMGDVVSPQDSYWQTVKDLKKALDPDNIIAPGRYNLI